MKILIAGDNKKAGGLIEKLLAENGIRPALIIDSERQEEARSITELLKDCQKASAHIIAPLPMKQPVPKSHKKHKKHRGKIR